MSFPLSFPWIGSLLAALAMPLAAQAQTAASADTPSARVIVRFKDDSTLLRKQVASVSQRHSAQAQALGARLGLSMRTGRGVAERTQVVFAAGISSEALATRLSQEKDIEYAVPDRRKTRATAPNDPLYATAGAPNTATQSGGPVVGQWYLRAPDSTVASPINAEGAWAVAAATATPVVVAVLDTGVRTDHPELTARLLAGYDMIGADRDDNGNPIAPTSYQQANDGDGRDADPSDPGDGVTAIEANTQGGLFYGCTTLNTTTGKYVGEPSSWHGTQTSGIIGAATDNGAGMASVGRERVKVLPVRVLGKCGGWDSDIIAGMNWAAGISVPGVPDNPNPAKVLNLSLGGSGSCTSAYKSAVAAINAAGAVVVASAGNGEGLAVSEPANCPGVIGVGGLRHQGDKVGYSDLGPELTISAPAGNCINTNGTDPCLYPILTTSNSGVYDPVSDADGGSIYTDAFNATLGTSFSAPLVSGTAALMFSVNPSLTPTQVKQMLMGSARAFPSVSGNAACKPPSSTVQDQCNCTTSTCGAGMLDAAAAVSCVQSGGACVPASGGGGGALGLDWLVALGLAVMLLSPRRARSRGPAPARGSR